jgi:hypothetical protein
MTAQVCEYPDETSTLAELSTALAGDIETIPETDKQRDMVRKKSLRMVYRLLIVDERAGRFAYKNNSVYLKVKCPYREIVA